MVWKGKEVMKFSSVINRKGNYSGVCLEGKKKSG